MQLLLQAGALCTAPQGPGLPLGDRCAELVDALVRCAAVTASAQLQEGDRSATVEVSWIKFLHIHYLY
jgi:hypothetical protein